MSFAVEDDDSRRKEAEVVEIISSDDEDETPASYEPLPSCPICLNDILDLAEKAVTDCMHTFCRPCLTEWLRLKRVCPLCKRRIRSYLTHIVDDANFTTVDVPPSPQPHHHHHHHWLVQLQLDHQFIHQHQHHHHHHRYQYRQQQQQQQQQEQQRHVQGVEDSDRARAGADPSSGGGVTGAGGGGSGNGAVVNAAVVPRRQLLTRSDDAGELLRQLHRIADRLGELESDADDLPDLRGGARSRSYSRGRGLTIETGSGDADDARGQRRGRHRSRDPGQQQQQQQQQHGRNAADPGSSSQPQPQPRPYFFRVQQRLAATAATVLGGPALPQSGTSPSASDRSTMRTQASRWERKPAEPGSGAAGLEGRGLTAQPSATLALARLAQLQSQPGEAVDPAVAARRRVYESGAWAAGVSVPGGGSRRWASPRPQAIGGLPLGGSAASSSGNQSAGVGGVILHGQVWPAATAAPRGAVPGLPRAAGVRRDQLERWVSRELRAVLGGGDLTLLRALVMGLVDVYGTERDWASEQPGGARNRAADGSIGEVARHPAGGGAANQDLSRAGRGDGPVQALQPFLFDRAAHFWHELRCFVLSGLSIEAYDTNARYGSRTPAEVAAEPSRQAQHQTRLEQQQSRQQPQLALAHEQGDTDLTVAGNAGSDNVDTAAAAPVHGPGLPAPRPASGLPPPSSSILQRRPRPLSGAPLALLGPQLRMPPTQAQRTSSLQSPQLALAGAPQAPGMCACPRHVEDVVDLTAFSDSDSPSPGRAEAERQEREAPEDTEAEPRANAAGLSHATTLPEPTGRAGHAASVGPALRPAEESAPATSPLRSQPPGAAAATGPAPLPQLEAATMTPHGAADAVTQARRRRRWDERPPEHPAESEAVKRAKLVEPHGAGAGKEASGMRRTAGSGGDGVGSDPCLVVRVDRDVHIHGATTVPHGDGDIHAGGGEGHGGRDGGAGARPRRHSERRGRQGRSRSGSRDAGRSAGRRGGRGGSRSPGCCRRRSSGSAARDERDMGGTGCSRGRSRSRERTRRQSGSWRSRRRNDHISARSRRDNGAHDISAELAGHSSSGHWVAGGLAGGRAVDTANGEGRRQLQTSLERRLQWTASRTHDRRTWDGSGSGGGGGGEEGGRDGALRDDRWQLEMPPELTI